MKSLKKFAVPLMTLICLFPNLVLAHPGHDQSMNFVHAFEAFGLILAAVVGIWAVKRHSRKD